VCVSVFVHFVTHLPRSFTIFEPLNCVFVQNEPFVWTTNTEHSVRKSNKRRRKLERKVENKVYYVDLSANSYFFIHLLSNSHDYSKFAQFYYFSSILCLWHSMYSTRRETYADEGNYSTSFLEYTPSHDDHLAVLVCKAENHRLPNSSVESTEWRLNVLCKFQFNYMIHLLYVVCCNWLFAIVRLHNNSLSFCIRLFAQWKAYNCGSCWSLFFSL